MPPQINELLDTPDRYETVRDMIAAILATEIGNQQALASTSGQDPDLYAVDVFSERSFSVERFLEGEYKCPLVNVWWQSLNEHTGTSTVHHTEDEVVYFLDFVAAGRTADDGGDGHVAGDRQARLAVQRAIRLVRQILMSGQYTYLGSPRKAGQIVFGRAVQSIVVNEPEYVEESRLAQWIATARMTLRVRLAMDSPQVQGETIELITNSVTRSSDGKVLARADYAFTP